MEKIRFDLEELHQVQAGLLKKLVYVCEEHKLSYFLAFGSLLGAVREHRILEWDDSVDVVMPYEDYSALLQLPETVWGDGLFLQTSETDPEYPKYYAKLRNSNTAMILAEYAEVDMNHGIFINIMPLVSLAYDPGERKKQIRDARLYKTFMELKPAGKTGSSFQLYASAMLALTPEKLIPERREAFKEKMLRYEKTASRDCFALAGERSLDLALPKKWFSEAVDWEFEGMQVRIPVGWKEWLQLRYGDYMKVPIADLQGEKTLNFVTLSTSKSYQYYKGKTYCLNHAEKTFGGADKE